MFFYVAVDEGGIFISNLYAIKNHGRSWYFPNVLWHYPICLKTFQSDSNSLNSKVFESRWKVLPAGFWTDSYRWIIIQI